MKRSFWGRGARQWGEDHKVGRAQERKRAYRGPISSPDERPACPYCGAHGTRINKAGLHKKTGAQIWFCFDCRRRFYEKTFKRCPQCGSTRIEKEPDDTWVCWNCDWFS